MELKRVGKSPVHIPPITFGAWAIDNWGAGSVERENVIKTLRLAIGEGFTAIDTAPMYGLGHSERAVAEATRDLPREKFQIMTKCCIAWKAKSGQNVDYSSVDYQDILNAHEFFPDFTKDGIVRQCEESLSRLGIDYIDLFSIHWPNRSGNSDEAMEAFELLLKEGKILAAGVCNHSLPQMQACDNIVNISSNKVRYSMLNRRVEDDLASHALQTNKSLLAYSVLQRGILSGIETRQYIWGPDEENIKELALYKPRNLTAIKAFLAKIAVIAADYNLSLSELCIHWAVRQQAICSVLTAASSPSEVQSMLRAVATNVADQDMQNIAIELTSLENVLDYSVGAYSYDYEKGVVNFE